jgi:hypothetical protein
VVLVDAADRTNYAQTTYIQSNDKPFTQSMLMNILRSPAESAHRGSATQPNVDLRIIVGKDFDVGLLGSIQ